MNDIKKHSREILQKLVLLVLLTFCWVIGSSQMETEIVGIDLRNPTGIEIDAEGNLWIAEAGSGSNDAAVTIIWADGTQERVVDGLASAFDTTTMNVDGAHRVQSLGENYVGILMDEGSAEVGSRIMVYERAKFVPGSMLSASDAIHTVHSGQQMKELGLASNTFSFVHDGCDVYMADAAANALTKRDGLSGVISVVAELPAKPNPLPFGPPFIESVPTRILSNPAGGFLVSEFTGFPFADGSSSILEVDADGKVSTYDSAFTLLTDMRASPDGDGIYVLQYASFRLDSTPPWVIGSSMVIHRRNDGSRDTLATGFGPSAGMALDEEGSIYVTNLFFGNVMKLVPSTTTSNVDHGPSAVQELNVMPNPGHDRVRLEWNQSESGKVELEVLNLHGQRVIQKSLGMRQRGLQTEIIDEMFTEKMQNGPYVIRIASSQGEKSVVWIRN